MTIRKGTILNSRYRIDEFIGRGGMAEVYKVWDLQRSVTLAIKVLNPELAEDKVFLRRFQREAQILSKLQHPNILRFYGLESSDGLVYLVLDYVDGITLRRLIHLESKPLNPEMVSEIVNPVCSALFYAHKLGVVHCDIKPANIMIDQTGKVLVTDFGISRITESATVTLVGAGTPAYMSPEQIKGKDPLPSMDIYSLGVVMFEMLTGGERPFIGDNAQTTGSTSEKIRWEQLHAEPPSPRAYNPALSHTLASLVMNCLEKNPENRAKTMQDLQEGLNSASPGGDGRALVRFMGQLETSQNPALYGEAVLRSTPTPIKQDIYEQVTPKKSNTGLIVGISLVSIVILILFIALVSTGQNTSSRRSSSNSSNSGAVVVQKTRTPTKKPTAEPTTKPTKTPTPEPTKAPTKKPTSKPVTNPTSSKLTVYVKNNGPYVQDFYFSHDRMCTLAPGEHCTFSAPRGLWSIDICPPGVYPCNNEYHVEFYGEYKEITIGP